MQSAKTTELGIQATTMAIREELMQYFKGGYVERLTVDSNVWLRDARNMNTRYYYQRLERDNKSTHIVLLGALPLFTVSKMPDKLVLHAQVLDRSPQLREVRANIEEFMGKYLAGVEIKVNEKGVLYA